MMDPLLLFIAFFIFRSLFLDPQTPFFRPKIFSDVQSALHLFGELGCTFSPLLMTNFRSATPPTIAILKSLPPISLEEGTWKKRWGVYIIILEKDGHRPAVYVGSGTQDKEGMHARIRDAYIARRFPFC
jgi:hypothetical protein